MQVTAFSFAIIAFVFAITGYYETNRLKKRLDALEATTSPPTPPQQPMS